MTGARPDGPVRTFAAWKLCAGLVLVLVAGTRAPALAQGVLAFETEQHAFEPIAEGDTAVHVFAFTNTGDAPLRLSDVEASCGCTTPSFTTDTVAPGARGTVTVAYDSRNRPGPFERVVVVWASNGEPASTLLRITGSVVPSFVPTGVRRGPFVFAADDVEAPPLAATDLLQHAFRFQHVGERPVRILGVEAPEGVEVVAPEQPLYPGDVYSVVVLADRPADLAARSGAIDIEALVHLDASPETPIRLRLRAQLETPSGTAASTSRQ